jgi:23S rRNA (pseudouridine1915-N3)-methyltransferase
MKIKIIASGRNKDKNLLALQEEYFKRCRGWKIELIETENPLARIPANAFVIALDERGKDLKTSELSAQLEKAATNSKEIIFIIGAADGHSDEVRENAHMLLAFGKLTWAHMLVRLMLAEQIYRLWSLSNHHPYHRE